jgi:hypothetical protein
VPVDLSPAMPGDVLRTGGDSRLARDLLGWQPATRLFDGILQQVLWRARELNLSTPRLASWDVRPAATLDAVGVVGVVEPAV